MEFDEWWKKKAPDINRALKSNHEYIRPFFENAYEWGKACGESLARKRHPNNAMHSDGQSDTVNEIWTNEDESAEIERQIVENARR